MYGAVCDVFLIVSLIRKAVSLEIAPEVQLLSAKPRLLELDNIVSAAGQPAIGGILSSPRGMDMKSCVLDMSSMPILCHQATILTSEDSPIGPL